MAGLHNWPAAAEVLPKVSYLAHPHRHEFFFELKKKVDHDDRDIEIINFENEVKDYLKRNFYNQELDLLDFGARSCEMLAQDLVEAYDLCSAQVLEDNLLGAIVEKEV